MALPPGFLDDLKSRVSITQVVGRKVAWDMRKSNQAKGDMWAPCPFHQEKTASFHVDDRKGYYYCFGCQAKGDALGFIKETENVSFMEAVEILAREAGMQMPAQDPRAQEKTDHRTRLAAVMEEAVKFFRLQLQTRAGEAARQYLDGRGLSPAALERWEIGFAPNAWQGLWEHLAAKDISEDMILAAGLAKPSNTGKRPYDTFRNRIMFPIRDPRGRAIAFGGRAMDPGESAKYLNSPQTDLFDKSRVLYNHGPARVAAGKGQALIVAEGYMDVIALTEAGFGAAVAPLGTAVTEHHLQHLWRITDEPIIALDGDAAGLRAAQRVIDISLPLLTAGKSLRFAIMPEGKDPDDLIRAGGPSAMQAALDTAQPIVQLLWQRETQGKTFDSPERKAALDKSLRAHLMRLEDRSLRQHYGQAIKDLRFDLFRSQAPGHGRGNKGNLRPRPAQAVAATKASSVTQGVGTELREAVVLASILRTPQVLGGIAPHLEDIQFSNPRYDQMRGFFASYIGTSEALWAASAAGFGEDYMHSLMAAPHVQIAPSVRRAGDIDFVVACLQGELKQITAPQAHALEMADGERDISDTADEGLTWRIAQSAKTVAEAQRGPQEDAEEYDTADNGAKVKRDERSAFDDLLDQITFKKTPR